MNELEKDFNKMSVQNDQPDPKKSKHKTSANHRARRSSSTVDATKIKLTVGRWQPPHNGHGLLIREVISKSSEDPESIGLIYIPPNAVETMGLTNRSARNNERFKNKIAKQAQKYRSAEMKVDPGKAVSEEMDLELESNPLPSIKRWYYLNLMKH